MSEGELVRRRRVGLDRWDEMWEGVLHLPPAPNDEHQRMLDELIEFLGPLLRSTGRGTRRSGVNLFRATTGSEDYRIPDLSFVARGRESIIATDGIRGGGPDAVIEIRSPDDETFEKLPFFARIGLAGVIVIDRDSKRLEIDRLAGAQYVMLQPDHEGWLASETLGVRSSTGARPTEAPTLIIEDHRDRSNRREIRMQLTAGRPVPAGHTRDRRPHGTLQQQPDDVP